MDHNVRQELRRAAVALLVFVALIGALVLKRHLTSDAKSTRADDGRFGPTTELAFMGDEILPPRTAPPFRLTDRSGEPMSLDDFRGRVVLLSFAYTNCATICPMIFGSFLNVERTLKQEHVDDVSLMFITLDPDLDTPQRLQEATEYVGGHWHFMTAEEKELQDVWRSYRVFREKKNGVVDHSGLTYLIDGQGLLRVRYGGTPQPKVLLNDIERLRKSK